ncbi:MAG: hypothetical protein EOP47_24640, partial [Sphingobacteriaceae bacterium]
MNFFKKIITVFALMLAVASFTFAQQPKISFTNFNSSDGLSQNSILSLFKDSYGFIWVGTQDGLNKYDGYKVTVYKHLARKPNTLPANYITAINEDAERNLWIGTRIGGLSKYVRKQKKYLNFKHDLSDNSTLSNNNVQVVYIDKQGGLWIGTENGLNFYDKKTGRFKNYFHKAGKNTSLSNSAIYSIFEDAEHNLWVGTANGLNLFNRKNGQCKRFFNSSENEKTSVNFVYAITEDSKHNLWMGTTKGLSLLNKKDGTLSHFAVERDQNSIGGVNPVYCLAKSDNLFWLGTNSTLQLFDIDKRQLIKLDDETIENNLMPNDGIYSIYEDKAGILWVGTTSQGILKYNKNLPVFRAYKTSLTATPSAKNIIRDIAEDKKGNLYLATDAGLEYLNRSTGVYSSYKHISGNPNSLLSNYTTSLVISKKSEDVWIGSYSSGLNRLDTRTGKVQHYTAGNGPKQISGNGIFELLEDSHGNIWAGTDLGVSVFDTNTKTFTKYIHDPKNSNTICDQTIQALREDKEGNIWIGGYSNGISIFNPATKNFKQLNTRNSKLNSDVISVFYEDKKGNMWIGTMEGGLNCYNPKTKKITAFSEQNGFINNTINYITEDAEGYLWVATNKGITRFDPVHITFKQFNLFNGLRSLELNLGSGARLSTGEIAMGSINGFNIIDLKLLSETLNLPCV